MSIITTLELVLRNLENVVERSKKIKDIDDYLERALTQHKREHLLKSLKDAIKLVTDSAQRQIKMGAIPRSEILVHSMYHSWRRGNKNREGYVTNTIHYKSTGIDETFNNKFLRTYDSYSARICYYDEFEERSEILLKAVEKGQLDTLFKIPPFDILHQIIGRYGEILPKLGIDPFKSRIHKIGKFKIINHQTRKVE